jgi:uncharacterized protein (DUF1697 family)
MRYVALLRVVNLGSHKKLAMPELRKLLTGLGYADVETYLQSGNAVFTAAEPRAERVGAEIEERLARDLGKVPATMRNWRTVTALRALADG